MGKECKCKDPKNKPDKNCPGTCGEPKYKGDGNCDDDNNNCGCAYDGGDCCAKSVAGGTVKLTARNASSRIPSTQSRDATIHARLNSTSAMATATTTTTTVAAITMEAIAVRNLSQVEKSKHLTARNASARIPRTNPPPTRI